MDGQRINVQHFHQLRVHAFAEVAIFIQDNGDSPIYDKETLDNIIGENVTFDDVKTLVESK